MKFKDKTAKYTFFILLAICPLAEYGWAPSCYHIVMAGFGPR